jgi:hypothetical protein
MMAMLASSFRTRSEPRSREASGSQTIEEPMQPRDVSKICLRRIAPRRKAPQYRPPALSLDQPRLASRVERFHVELLFAE